MADQSMPFQKGQSGNPKGRPPGTRALTAILEQAGARSVDVGGKKVAGKRIAAQMVWQALTTGRVTFPDGAVLLLDPDQWLGMLKFTYGQVDGPPKQQMELTGKDAGPVEHVHRFDLSGLSSEELDALECIVVKLAQPGGDLGGAATAPEP